MKSMRILGPFPPPFGGVAIHCVRLLEALRTRGINVQGLSLGGLPVGLPNVSLFRPWHLLSRTPVHYHTDEGNFRWMLLLSRIWRILGTKYIVTVHSFRHRSEFDNPGVLKNLRKAYERAEAIIAISDEAARDLQNELGVVHKRLKVIPSNLPLSRWESGGAIPTSVPEQWHASSARILANAGAVSSLAGKDLYGIDVLLEALKQIADPRIQLCIAIGGVRDQSQFERIVEAAKLDTRVHLVSDLNGPLAPLVRESHIVVRPTRTEGGPSLTVTEAMELGRWTIASDAVTRPAGCRTFRSEDAADLARVIIGCVNEVAMGNMPAPTQPYSQALTQLINLYQRLGFVSTIDTPADV
jgi:glycosyltransferase involved in cell wall biosynthesis